MLISVVIPLYNKQYYIRKAIESVLIQTNPCFELIVVDDGSTDQSADIVNSFEDHRILLIQQENSGVSKARNKGVYEANGDWVSFLDADDEYEPDFLKEAENFINGHTRSNISFLGTNYYIRSRECIANSLDISTGIYDYPMLFRDQKSPNNSSSTIVNREAFLLTGGFSEEVKYFEDWITWFKLGIIGKFGYISRPLAMYNFIEGSVSRAARDMKEFYNSAVSLPVTLNEYLSKNSRPSQDNGPIRKRIASFSISIAEILAIGGERGLSIRMMRFVSPQVFVAELRKSFRTLLFLLLPLCVRKLSHLIRQ